MKIDQQEEPLNVDKNLKRDATREDYSKESCSRTILIMIQTYNTSPGRLNIVLSIEDNKLSQKSSRALRILKILQESWWR